MSAAKLFPQFKHVPPTKLRKAIQELETLHTGAGGQNSTRWQALLDKLRSQTPLSNFEKKQMAANCGSIPDNLRHRFAELFIRDLDEGLLADVSQTIAFMLGPCEAIDLLTHQEIKAKFGDKHLPPGVFRALNKLGKDQDEQDWVDSELRSSIAPNELVTSLQPSGASRSYSFGQKRIIRRILLSKVTASIVNTQYHTILDFLFALKDENADCLILLDGLLGNYFQFDRNWSGKVLDESYFLNNLFSRLPELLGSEDRLNQYRNIDLLRLKITEISNVLKELNAVEPDRGTFWRKYLARCQYVEPKRINKNSVAVAFAFSNFVVVEFAPVGRAALLYDRNTFDSKVRFREDWRIMDSVKAFPPYSADGRLLHYSDWQIKFNELIILLLRQGGAKG